MTAPHPIAEIWRGPILESAHLGHAVVADSNGVHAAWGDSGAVILPRSSCKMIQALPLVMSGAADDARLGDRHLALSCASHSGAHIHTGLANTWLRDLGLTESDYRCGAQEPEDIPARDGLIRDGQSPGQIHNNCSGKHAGFLTLTRHLKAGPEYIDVEHPVQQMVRDVFCDLTGATGDQWAIDGCSAPNFACSISGLAQAMAWFATASQRSDTASAAAGRLVQAMMAHPELVAGEGRACTELMRAANGRAVVKTGAEGVYIAILPEHGLGVAVKAVDGATRAAECAIAALLVHLAILPADHPAIRRRLKAPLLSRRGVQAGYLRAAPGFP